MTKKLIDYTKTIFYKIVCNDLNIKDCYIGHTTQFIKRKSAHKYRCIDENNKKYNIYLYEFIRNNGGWDNWDMIMIEEIKCENVLDAKRQERKFIEEYQASLNKQTPSKTYKEWCDENKDKLKQYKKTWYENNKDKQEYKDKQKINKKKYINQDEYKIKENERQKEYRKINKDKINTRERELYQLKKLKKQQDA